ncbi:MAG: hypothetical protein VKL39_17570 [Leptolyngbyaceae bacterium]|nr:hypothetical protein [Leptolyngbyaceae bacterium]
MADIKGTALAETDHMHRAPGTAVDAGLRSHRNTFDLAVDGGAQDNLCAAKIREGNHVVEIVMQSSANLSAINFTIGTDADVDKYGTAQAGPNATEKKFIIPIAVLAGAALTEMEEIKFFPSGNLPSSGTIVTRIVTTKR